MIVKNLYLARGAGPKPALIRTTRNKLVKINQTCVAHWGCQTNFSHALGCHTGLGCTRGVPVWLVSHGGGGSCSLGIPDLLELHTGGARQTSVAHWVTLTDTFNCWSSNNHWFDVFFQKSTRHLKYMLFGLFSKKIIALKDFCSDYPDNTTLTIQTIDEALIRLSRLRAGFWSEWPDLR